MRMMPSKLLITFAILWIAGCETINPQHSDTCGRESIKEYIGTPIDAFISNDHFQGEHTYRDNGSRRWDFHGRTYYIEVFDPRGLLPGEDLIVVTDYSPQRLRIFVDKDGIMEKLTCG